MLEADRENRRRNDEPTGEPESLWGKMDTLRMGDRLTTESRKAEFDEKIKKSSQKYFYILDWIFLCYYRRERASKQESRVSKKARKESILKTNANILADADEYSYYRPKTRESRTAYEHILTLIQRGIGDQPQV